MIKHKLIMINVNSCQLWPIPCPSSLCSATLLPLSWGASPPDPVRSVAHLIRRESLRSLDREERAHWGLGDGPPRKETIRRPSGGSGKFDFHPSKRSGNKEQGDSCSRCFGPSETNTISNEYVTILCILLVCYLLK
jgi:hypothetical protein